MPIEGTPTAPTSMFIGAGDAEVEKVGAKTHYWYTKPGLVHTEKVNFIRVTLPPGEYHDFHNHPSMEEVLYVTAGKAEQWLEKEMRILNVGDAVHIPKGLIHATFNAGEDELEFLAVLTPADSGEEMTVDHSQEEPWKSLRSSE